MLRTSLAFCLILATVIGRADEPSSSITTSSAPVPNEPATTAQPRRARPTGPVPTPIDPATAPTDGRPPAQFVTEARWQIAGYNNEEIIYTILITNHDTRILRCSTELKGFYFENGEKRNVADRQISTVLPDQQVQAGNWMGMDKDSGAIYATKCRAL